MNVFYLALILVPCLTLAQNPQNWMSGLSDNISIKMVSIPGTHDTGTWDESLTPGRCQSWSLKEQLNNGIRFVDIRGRHYQDALPIHHGLLYQDMDIGDILDDCVDFLNKNPSEFIVMRIKEEYNTAENTLNYKETLEKYLKQYKDSYFWKNANIPSVGQSRGKIVILHEWTGPTLGIDWETVDLKDDYQVPTLFHINAKWNGCKNHMDNAMRQTSSPKLFVTFTSGTGPLAYPNAVASYMNPKLEDFLSINQGYKRIGIVAMDFPTEANVHMIMQCNFNLYHS